MTVLLSIAIAVIIGLLMTRIAKPLGLPAVTAYLVTGVLIGPYCLGRLGIGGIGSFGEVDHLVNTFGAHRFVVSSTAGCISAGALGMVYLGRFSQEDKDMILGGNWQRLQEEIKWA